MDPPHLGVLTGIRAEADLLIRHLPPDLQVTVQLSGARPGQARARAEALAESGATHLLSFGYAGGLDPALRPGLLLLPRFVTAPDGMTYAADGDWLGRALDALQGLQPLAAGHLGVDEAIVDAEGKATAFLRSRGARAVDMESHVLAETAQRRGLPFLAVRVILDSADHALPPAALRSVTAKGEVSLLRLMASLATNPTQIGGLNRLAKAQREAARGLLGCCRRAGPTGFGVR